MTANHDLRRRLARHYETEPPLRAPDWMLQTALSTIESTPQRRGPTALRRYPNVQMYTKLAAAAVVVVAVGGLALWQLGAGDPGGPTPAPSSTALPTPTEPTAPVTAPPASRVYVPPPLTQTFTSDVHGVSLAFPEGWTAQAATTPWTTSAGPFLAGDPAADLLTDPNLEGIFIAIASQPLGEMSFEAWSTSGVLATEGCGTSGAPIVVDGADGIDCGELALVGSGGRGYVIWLHTSGDSAPLLGFDPTSMFSDILASVQLSPEDAVD